MADSEVTYDLETLFSSSDDGTDFLVRNNSDQQVNISSLTGKMLALYFSGSWCPSCRRFTPILTQLYQELSSADFEVVFISSDKDEESFHAYFSTMPWLSIPFSHSETLKHLKELFKVRGVPHLVLLDSNGNLSTHDGVRLIREYGVQAYPFNPEKINFLKQKDAEVKSNQTLTSVLVSPSRDYVLSNDGNQIPVSQLQGKVVGLYFSVYYHQPCLQFTETLLEVYNKLREKEDKFEIVMISLDREEEQFEEGFQSVPWLALPFNDEKSENLARYFELKTIPSLVIIGPDGKTLNLNAAELVEEHGVDAFPFTPEKLVELAEIEKAKLEFQTLESFMVSGDRDFVIDKSGIEIPVSELVGKYVLLYFSAHWCPPCRAFLPKLIEAYHEIKQKEKEFEIIFISSDRDQSSFDEFFSGMPWLALPFGDQRKRFLTRRFKIESIPAIVAINQSGRTVTTQARKLITTHGADAYPFTEEHLKQLGEKAKEGWVCERDVCCRKA